MYVELSGPGVLVPHQLLYSSQIAISLIVGFRGELVAEGVVGDLLDYDVLLLLLVRRLLVLPDWLLSWSVDSYLTAVKLQSSIQAASGTNVQQSVRGELWVLPVGIATVIGE